MDGLEDFLFEAILKHIPGVGEVEVFLTGDEDVTAWRLGDFRAIPHCERFCSLKACESQIVMIRSSKPPTTFSTPCA